MNRFLLDAAAPSGGSIAIYVVLIVFLVLMLVLPFISNRKKNKEYQSMIEALKVGDMVRTAGGVIGRITKITDKGEIKTVILETGTKSEKSYMEFDLSMIYCVLKSTKAENEEEKAAEEPAATETAEETASETQPETATEPAKEPEAPAETKAKKTTSARKTTKPKTSAKKAK